jgi:succinate dehydrogenase / fumarate reductase iron-sulfur subunit
MWTVHYRIFRFKQDGTPPRYAEYTVELRPDDSVLDGIEKIWAFQDRSLIFRHACHHASCGACGMRVNGVERLPCITLVREVIRDGGTLVCEPLRNFPVVSDLMVDLGSLFERLDAVQFEIVRPAEPLPEVPQAASAEVEYTRFEDCIECGLCVSACPAAAADPAYWGPAALAAVERKVVQSDPDQRFALLAMVDDEHALWRCHSAFECNEVCPSNVDPADKIMNLRRMVMVQRLGRLFGRG